MITLAPDVQYTKVNQAAGATLDIAADPGDGKYVAVMGIMLTCDTAGTILFHDDNSATEITGEMHCLAGTPLVAGWNGMPVMRGNASQKLQITTTQEFNGIIAWRVDTA